MAHLTQSSEPDRHAEEALRNIARLRRWSSHYHAATGTPAHTNANIHKFPRYRGQFTPKERRTSDVITTLPHLQDQCINHSTNRAGPKPAVAVRTVGIIRHYLRQCTATDWSRQQQLVALACEQIGLSNCGGAERG